jgi:hypothetical protein
LKLRVGGASLLAFDIGNGVKGSGHNDAFGGRESA